jgi:predicted ABC-type ATPase
MDGESPVIVVLASPNVAGKSTLGRQFSVRDLGVSEFVDADMFGPDPSGASSSVIQAGRAALRHFHLLAADRRRFGLETTLASLSLARRLRGLISRL